MRYIILMKSTVLLFLSFIILYGGMAIANHELNSSEGDYFEDIPVEDSDKGNYNVEYRESIQSWCRDQLRVLRRSKKEAQRHMSYGHYRLANQSLMRGLNKSLKNITSYYESTFTGKSIARAIQLAQKAQGSKKEKARYQRTLNYFLFEYYEFISFVSRELDSRFAWRRNCHFCGLSGNRQFEKNYIKFAKWQLQMVVDKLTTKGRSEWGAVVNPYDDRHSRHRNQTPISYYPIGVPEVFLSIFETSTRFTIEDLEASTFASQFACIIDELYYIHDRVSHYSSEFPDHYEAVQFAVGSAREVLSRFNCTGELPSDGVDWHHRRRSSTTFEGLKSPITLLGETKSIYLGETREIKKLIISAEGIRKDAMFNVVVNGEVKGTIYVPGRDPSYHVTIEDSASQIEFVPQYGRARIRRVLVITYPNY